MATVEIVFRALPGAGDELEKRSFAAQMFRADSKIVSLPQGRRYRIFKGRG
jgi:hypothetical protein